MTDKKCTRCLQTKPFYAYAMRATGKGGELRPRSQCRQCEREAKRAARLANPDASRADMAPAARWTREERFGKRDKMPGWVSFRNVTREEAQRARDGIEDRGMPVEKYLP